MTVTESITVSVIIPTKNRNEFLQRAVDSVVAQKYNSLEICVVDNNDDTLLSTAVRQMVEHYRRSHGGMEWTYIPSRQLYASGVKNDGMRLARGRYICFLDDDDQLLPGSIARRVREMDAHSDLALLYCGGYSLIYPYPFRMYRYYRYDRERDKETLKMMSCSSMFINKALFAVHGLFFDESISRLEDYDLCKMIIRLNLKVASIPRSLVMLHHHPFERMSTHTPVNAMDFREKLVQKWGPSAEEYVYNYIAGHFIWRICFGIERKKYSEIAAELKKDFGREPSPGFRFRHRLVSFSPLLFLFTYHCTLIIWQFYHNRMSPLIGKNNDWHRKKGS